MILAYKGISPKVPASSYVAPNATLIGDLELGEQTGIWFGAVLRGDVMPLRIGARTNIQDNSVVHATGGWHPTIIGEDCTVGHAVIVHGCTIGDRVLVGMGSIILDAAEIGSDTILGAGSLVTTNAKIPSGVLAVGRPAKVVRELNEKDFQSIRAAAEIYVQKIDEYKSLV